MSKAPVKLQKLMPKLFAFLAGFAALILILFFTLYNPKLLFSNREDSIRSFYERAIRNLSEKNLVPSGATAALSRYSGTCIDTQKLFTKTKVSSFGEITALGELPFFVPITIQGINMVNGSEIVCLNSAGDSFTMVPEAKSQLQLSRKFTGPIAVEVIKGRLQVSSTKLNAEFLKILNFSSKSDIAFSLEARNGGYSVFLLKGSLDLSILKSPQKQAWKGKVELWTSPSSQISLDGKPVLSGGAAGSLLPSGFYPLNNNSGPSPSPN